MLTSAGYFGWEVCFIFPFFCLFVNLSIVLLHKDHVTQFRISVKWDEPRCTALKPNGPSHHVKKQQQLSCMWMQSVQITALESVASDGKYTITSPSFELGQPWAGLLPHLRCQVSFVTNPPKQFFRLTQTGSTSPCLRTSSVPSHEPPVYPVMNLQCTQSCHNVQASAGWCMHPCTYNSTTTGRFHPTD